MVITDTSDNVNDADQSVDTLESMAIYSCRSVNTYERYEIV